MQEANNEYSKQHENIAHESIAQRFYWHYFVFAKPCYCYTNRGFSLFNPSDYKTQVSAFIMEKSGMPMEIKGDIQLRYFPWLGLHVEDVRLPQAPEFGSGDFINIEALEFKIPITGLFKHQLIVETLSIKGLNLQLVKAKDGSTNWDYFSKQLKNKSADSKPTQESDNNKKPATTSGKKSKKISFALNNFDAQNATITLNDQAQQETLSISNLQLSGDASQIHSIPLKGKFDIEQKNAKTNSTLISGHSDYQGTITFNKKLTANIDTTLVLTFPQNPTSWQKVNADLNIKLDPANAIFLKDIRLQVGDLNLQGSSMIPMSDAPITFSLKMNQLNVDQIMNKNATVTNTVNASPSRVENPRKNSQSATPSNSASGNKTRAIMGEVLIDKVIVKNLSLENVKATVKKDNNLLKFAPLTASLYQGSLNVQVVKDLANPNVPTTFQGTLNNIQIQPMLTSYNQEHRLTGSADIDFNMSQGNQLNGVTKVKIKNGTVRGIDIKYYLSIAQSLFNKEKNPLPDNKTTSFGDLTATLNFHDDMIDNNDLSIQSTDFKASGEGSVYLVSKTIEYKIQAKRQYRDDKEHPNDFPLAIRIKGSFDTPQN